MNNQFFLMIIFCLISNVAYSMPNDLDHASEAKLIAHVKEDIVKTGYWPSDVVVRLEQFYKMPDSNGSGTRYFVRVVGSYSGYVLIETVSGDKMLRLARLGKGTEGIFSKEELESFGIQLPE